MVCHSILEIGMRAILGVIGALLLAGCASGLDVTIVDLQSGVVGRGEASSGQFGGPMTLSMEGSEYQGNWSAVRTSTETAYTGYAQSNESNGVGSGQAFLTPRTASTTGHGQATLSASTGRVINCQFDYSSASGATGATGTCQSNDGRSYSFSAY